MNAGKLIGYALILLGILAFTPLSPLATVIIDTTAPTRTSSIPTAGQTYSTLTSVSIKLSDGDSGIGTVTFKLDSGSAIGLSLSSGTETSGTWSATISNPAAGSHTFTFTFKDQSGNSGTYTGSFTIYSALSGTWYIDGEAIASSSDAIQVNSRAVPFKFVKSAGVSDSSITCKMTITSGGSGSLTLTNSAANTWTGTYTFPSDGSFSIELKATDGTGTPVVMSLINVGSGSTLEIPTLKTGYFIGAALMVSGFLLVRRFR